MFNTSQYNTTEYNLQFKELDMAFSLCKYNNYDLNNGTTTFIDRIDYLSQSNIPYNIYDLGNKKFINTDKYTTDEDIKEITISGVIKEADREAVVDKMEELKGNVIRQKWDLEIKEWNIVKSATAYCNSIEFTEQEVRDRVVEYVMSFTIFGWLKKQPADQVVYNITSQLNEVIANIGDNRAEWISAIEINSASSVSYINIQVGDANLTINDTPSVNDVYKLYSDNLIITKNGNSINYDGSFNKLAMGDNDFSINSDGTFDYTVNFKYNLTYR